MLENIVNKCANAPAYRTVLFPELLFIYVVQVPDYLKFIKHPMDFSTMEKKIYELRYRNLDDFQKDFDLIVNNCMAYNARDTMFYASALKMRNQVRRFVISTYVRVQPRYTPSSQNVAHCHSLAIWSSTLNKHTPRLYSWQLTESHKIRPVDQCVYF